MASRKTGDWDKAREIFETMAVDMANASKSAITQEAHFLRGEIIKGIRTQEPGGKAFTPLSPLTLAARRLEGFRGTKALAVHGDLRNGITVSQSGSQTFIGILRTAKSSGATPLVNIAEVQEYGAGPFVIPITPKMRRYLAVLMKEAHGEKDADIPKPFWLIKAKANAKQTLIVKIPARPFIRPIFEAFAQPEDVKKRLTERMEKMLKNKLAK